jgi:hypothetical protein
MPGTTSEHAPHSVGAAELQIEHSRPMTFPARRIGLALDWVVRTLDAQEVPYQVVGGLAALAHGGSRPLFDIDLYAPLEGRAALLHSLRPHTVSGPEPFTDDVWDLVFMKLEYDGIRIEIGDAASSPRVGTLRGRAGR